MAKRPRARHDQFETLPDTPNLRVLRLAMQLAGDAAGAFKKCDRRLCRESRTCHAEGVLQDRLAYCVEHWTALDRQRFGHMAGFGLLLTNPPVPEGCSGEDAKAIWELCHGIKWVPGETQWLGLPPRQFSDKEKDRH